MIKFYSHPDYEAQVEHWETYRDLYEGQHRKLISPKYLWQHELEFSQQSTSTDPNTGTSETVGGKIRRIRALRSRYFNLFEPVISTWVSMALSKPMRIDPELADMLGEDINDIDGKGSSLSNFIMGPLAVSYFRDGKAAVLVDPPENTARTQAEQAASGFRPYMEIIDVLDLKDWQVTNGKFDAVRYEYEVIAPRSSMMEEPEEREYCKIFQKDPVTGEVFVSVYLEDEEGEEWTEVNSPTVLQGFEQIPIAVAHNNVSWVRDVAELQLVLFNLMSAHYNLLNTQAFQRVFISGDLQDRHLISISEYAVSVLPQEAKPFVVEPSDTQSLIAAINSTMDQLYRVAFNRTRGVAMDSKEAPGASTLREMSTELIALLIHAVGELEGVVNEALMHYAAFKLGPERAKEFKGRVTLSRDITADDIALQIQMFLAYRDEIRNVQSWRKAHLKKVAVTMGYNEDERVAILDDIENLEPLPQFNQTALPRGLNAQGINDTNTNVPLPEPRIRDQNGQ